MKSCPYCGSDDTFSIFSGVMKSIFTNSDQGNSGILECKTHNDVPSMQCVSCKKGFGSILNEMAKGSINMELQEFNGSKTEMDEFLVNIVLYGKNHHRQAMAIQYIDSLKMLLKLKLASDKQFIPFIRQRVDELKNHKY